MPRLARPIFQLLHRFPENHREKLNQRGEDRYGWLDIQCGLVNAGAMLVESLNATHFGGIKQCKCNLLMDFTPKKSALFGNINADL